jgi:hypothetical protein
MLVNKLKALTTEIDSFNEVCGRFALHGESLIERRREIIGKAEKLGIKTTEAWAMIAKIKLKVTMPGVDEGEAGPQNEAGEDGARVESDGLPV